MIQIYSPGNTNYDANGDCVLMPTTCTAISILKGEWKLTLEHPIDDESRWKYLEEGAVLSVPTFLGPRQLYRIFKITRSDTGVIADALPIFFDAAHDVFLLDSRPTNKNGQGTLDWLMAGTFYAGISNISDTHSANYVRKNLIEALNGSDDDSFINRWGGEPIYQNYTVTINEQAGSNRGVQILYGKNITAIQEEIDMSNVATRIVPIAYNEQKLAGSTPWIDSPLIDRYPIVYYKEVKYDDMKLKEDATEDDDPANVYDSINALRTAMVTRAQHDFEGGADKPVVTITVDMVDLSMTDEYKDYAVLEEVTLGDTVYCKHSKLGIVSEARVVEIDWDCILNCISTLKIGEISASYFTKLNNTVNKVSSTINNKGELVASKIAGLMDLQKTKLRYQRDASETLEQRSILFEDLDPSSPTFGALCIGTQGIEIASGRNGTDTDWIWGTAIDPKTIHAENMVAGIISDKLGKNYWNLDTGEFWLSGDSSINGTSARTIIQEYKNLTVVLDRDYICVPADSDGSYGTFPTRTIAIRVFYMQADVTSSSTITVAKTAGVTVSKSGSNITISGLSTDTGSVRVTASYTDTSGATFTDTAKVTIEKQKTGRTGKAYELQSNADYSLRGSGDTYSPDQITFSLASSGTAQSAYFRILASKDPGEQTWYIVSRSSSAATSITVSISSLLNNSQGRSMTKIACSAYSDSAQTNLIGNKIVNLLTDITAYGDETIFDILTQNGASQGLFLSDGKLYGNLAYAKFGGITGNIGGWTIEDNDGGLSSEITVDTARYLANVRPYADGDTKVFEMRSGNTSSTGWVNRFYVTPTGDVYCRRIVSPTQVMQNMLVYAPLYVGSPTSGELHGRVYSYSDGTLTLNSWTGTSVSTTYSVVLDARSNISALRPGTNALLSLGSQSYLWNDIYAINGTIQTSDANEKFDITPIDERIKNFILQLEPVSYKFIEGTSGRTHYGLTAQSVKDKMDSLGISDMEFAGYISYNKRKTVEHTFEVEDPDTGELREETYETTEEMTDDYGNPIKGYGLRYEEFIAPLIAVVQEQQRRIDLLENMLHAVLEELK